MESRYVDAEAERYVTSLENVASAPVALRTYTARLLGQDASLVLHGGGNTSVKAEATTPFGERVAVLHVKGSGWDLATIEPAGHPAVRMTELLRLLELDTMTDEAMVNAMRLALLDASAPTPSVEALLHAALPARFIDHTHADAVLAVCDQPDSERICREIYGDALLFVPYVMPGFGLAKACKKAWDDATAAGRAPTVMVLERHGIFTFGETAKESYGRMIDAVTRAERYADDRMGTVSVAPVGRDAALEARILPALRGALAAASGESAERGPVFDVRSDEAVLQFLERRDAADLVGRGCATPDHVIRTKPTALFFRDEIETDDEALRARLTAAIAAYGAAYDRYFEETCARKGVKRTKLDPWPRVVLVPKVGIIAVGRTKGDATIVGDVYEHTLQVMSDATDVGTYAPVSRDDLFDVEYWSLEQAKIKKVDEKPLSRRIALVTGAGGGIGLATATLFLEEGAHVALVDRDEAALAEAARALVAKHGARVTTVRADVTKAADVDAAFAHVVRTFGGVDVVVSNAGNAPEGRLDTAEGDERLRASLETNLLAHNLVASRAAAVLRRARRPGCLLFNASKSAFAPGPGFGPYAVAKAALVALVRQYAIDLGPHGIRANAVNADRIRTGLFGHGVLESRAAARGLSPDAYFRANLLGREVTGRDVAEAFAYLARASATTGAVLTVDGGNASAFPR